jgi:hypothetical protein
LVPAVLQHVRTGKLWAIAVTAEANRSLDAASAKSGSLRERGRNRKPAGAVVVAVAGGVREYRRGS